MDFQDLSTWRVLLWTAGIATALLTLLLVPRWHSSAAGKQAPPANKQKKPKPKKAPRMRMCKFCNVEIVSKAFMDAHVAGKRHKKLAEDCAPDECWVWVEKPPVPDEAPVATREHDVDMVMDGSWEGAKTRTTRRYSHPALRTAQHPRASIVAVVAKPKRGNRAGVGEAAAARAPRDGRDEARQQGRQRDEREEENRRLPRHRWCNGCGTNARYGAVIETDPDDVSKGMCSHARRSARVAWLTRPVCSRDSLLHGLLVRVSSPGRSRRAPSMRNRAQVPRDEVQS